MMMRIFRPERFTGWHMIGVLGLFFGTIIIVNAMLAIFASNTWTGLVVDNTYVESQRYNEKLEAAERQESLGWSGTFDYVGGRAAFSIEEADGTPILADRVTAVLRRPAYEQEDHSVVLDRMPDGSYALATSLGKGLWAADVAVTVAGRTIWTKRYRFTVDAEDMAPEGGS